MPFRSSGWAERDGGERRRVLGGSSVSTGIAGGCEGSVNEGGDTETVTRLYMPSRCLER